jgi:ABC-type nitrate/sulfonate/bicarbonate transport system permease component
MNERRAYVLMLLSVPLVWILAVKFAGLPTLTLPPPSLVAKVLVEERTELLSHTLVTVGEALLGYALANALALGLAVGFLYARGLEAFVTPWTVALKNIPFVTIASILTITLGDTLAPKLIIVVLVCFFPILANVAKGLKSVDSVLLDRMRTLNASRWQTFVRVSWPAALPYYMAAHEIAFTGSILGAIIAEWFFARKGLGFLIVRATTEYRADRLYAVTVIASLLAIGAYAACRAIERSLIRRRGGATS